MCFQNLVTFLALGGLRIFQAHISLGTNHNMYQHVMPLGSGKTRSFFGVFQEQSPKCFTRPPCLFSVNAPLRAFQARLVATQMDAGQLKRINEVRLKRVLVALGATCLCPTFQAFRTFDLDKDGSLSREELVRGAGLESVFRWMCFQRQDDIHEVSDEASPLWVHLLKKPRRSTKRM